MRKIPELLFKKYVPHFRAIQPKQLSIDWFYNHNKKHERTTLGFMLLGLDQQFSAKS